MEAMENEVTLLIRNKTQILVDKPEHPKIISSRWVHLVKSKEDDNID